MATTRFSTGIRFSVAVAGQDILGRAMAVRPVVLVVVETVTAAQPVQARLAKATTVEQGRVPVPAAAEVVRAEPGKLVPVASAVTAVLV